MTDSELHAIVAKDQHRRTVERALGRLQKALEEDGNGDGEYKPKAKSAGRPRTKSRVKQAEESLEGFGLSVDLCSKLRATGKPDWQIILELKGAGIL